MGMMAILTTPEARLSDRGLPCPADRISMPLSAESEERSTM
jgi:hypothetical protein